MNEIAFDGLCSTLWPETVAFHLRRCGGRVHVAEDLAQETFAAAASELRRGCEVAAPASWIFGIARHKLCDHYRRQRASAGRAAPAEAAERIADSRRTEVVVEQRDTVLAALAATAPQQRAALLLCYVEGLSTAEAGEVLGKSPEAVESLLARGRRAFRAAFEAAAY